MNKPVIELVNNKDFETLNHIKTERINRIINKFNKGYLTEEEKRTEIYQEIMIGSNEERIEKIIVVLGIGNLSEVQNNEFVEDYKRFKNKEQLKGEWLTGNQKFTAEEILKTVDSLLLPVNYFVKIPSDIPSPNISCFHNWAKVSGYKVKYNCVDDGGLFEDLHPEGKTFDLISSDGIKAKFKVNAYYPVGTIGFPDMRNIKTNATDYDYYQGEGEIENYYFEKSDENKDNMCINVIRKDGQKRIESIAMYSYGEMHYNFPRWREYINRAKQIQKNIENELEELVDSICEE